ncbi:MAG TPA: MCE family protein [Jatrophihabitantaceae bacterium]|jgi:phospholipid/cholesterol/gamma-HCH transport system substrate-binding protein
MITLTVLGAVLCGGVAYYLLGRDSTKSVTAQFSSAVGIYTGTPVKVLGIDVGKVTAVHPHGATVSVRMSYDRTYALPRNAIAVIVANSLVSDRFVQLAPAYNGAGPTLANDATIPESRTAAPAELDDIYAALNKLSVALGPKGANKNGSLRELVDVAAANLRGNGADLGTSISKLSEAAQTLASGRGDLFGTVKNLQAFTKALSDSDSAVRHFNQQLATVAGELAGERQDLGAALHNLGTALGQVADFVHTNAARAHTDIAGLRSLTQILVKEQASLNETLAVAPAALSNIVHAYQPDLGVIATRTNLDSLADPATLCALLDPALIPGVPDTVKSAAGGLTAPLKKTCAQVLAKIPLGELLGQLGLPTNLTGAALGEAVNRLIAGASNDLGGIITGGH